MFAAAAEMRGSPEVNSQSIVAFVVQAPAKRETAKAGSERFGIELTWFASGVCVNERAGAAAPLRPAPPTPSLALTPIDLPINMAIATIKPTIAHGILRLIRTLNNCVTPLMLHDCKSINHLFYLI